MIKFKRTEGQQECIELAYEPDKTVTEYCDDLSELFDCEAHEVKLVHKGKILAGKVNAEGAKISSATVMVVISQKKAPKKVENSEGRKLQPRKSRLFRGQG